jgi:hypothetical protein
MIKARKIRWAGQVAHMKETRNVYNLLMGEVNGERSLGRLLRCIYEVKR